MTDQVDTDQRTTNLLLLSLAFVYFLIEYVPGVVGYYGYFIDEFYYVACAQHQAFGFVDHPPLSILVLGLVRALMGDSLWALRLLPALAGAATIFLVGILARRLGADRFGQLLAAGAAMIGSIYHISFGFYSMNAFSILLWGLSFLVLIEILKGGRAQLWLWFGVLTGLGLENKHTFVLLLFGLAVGLILTDARRHLKSRWPWIGAALAIAIVLPNILWQTAHEWPSLEFYRNADLYKNVPTPPAEVFFQQVLTMNPSAFPVWIAGLFFFLVTRRGRPFRSLGWLYLSLLVLMLIGQKSRPDRIADAYLVLFAGGGVVLSEWAKRRRMGWLRWYLAGTIALSGAALAPIGLPLLSPEIAAKYAAWIGVVPQIEIGEGKRSDLPQWLADRLGWETLVLDLDFAAAQLGPEEREHAIFLLPSYGHAGAVELLGRGKRLPPVYAVQNTYFHWGPPEDPVSAAIIMEPLDFELATALFEEVEPVRVYDCDGCLGWRDNAQIWIGRKPRMTFREIWPRLKHYE